MAKITVKWIKLGLATDSLKASSIPIVPIINIDASDVQGALEKLKTAIDQLIVAEYGSWIPNAVSTRNNLPLTGNELNDIIIVGDDGDGRGALYSCIAITGDADAQWRKIADVDWTNDHTKLINVLGNGEWHLSASERETLLSGQDAAALHNHDSQYSSIGHGHSESDISGLDKYTQAEVDAIDAGVVHINGTETVSGTKLFRGSDSYAINVVSDGSYTGIDLVNNSAGIGALITNSGTGVNSGIGLSLSGEGDGPNLKLTPKTSPTENIQAGALNVDLSNILEIYTGSEWRDVSHNNIDSTDNAIARFDGTDGNIKNSSMLITDQGDYSTLDIPSGNMLVTLSGDVATLSLENTGAGPVLHLEPKDVPLSGTKGDFNVNLSSEVEIYDGSAWEQIGGGGGGGINAPIHTHIPKPYVGDGIIYIESGVAVTISKIRISAVTAPATNPLKIKVQKGVRSGTPAWADLIADADNKLSLAAGAYYASTTNLQNDSVTADNWLRINITDLDDGTAENIMVTLERS